MDSVIWFVALSKVSKLVAFPVARLARDLMEAQTTATEADVSVTFPASV